MNHPDRADGVGIRLEGRSDETGRVTVALTRIPYDDAATLDTPTPAYECDLKPDAGGIVSFSVEGPDDDEVLALAIEE